MNERNKTSDDVFLMCASVMLAKESLEDIEDIKDGKEYAERMLEAHRHLTEAVETYNTIIVNNNH